MCREVCLEIFSAVCDMDWRQNDETCQINGRASFSSERKTVDGWDFYRQTEWCASPKAPNGERGRETERERERSGKRKQNRSQQRWRLPTFPQSLIKNYLGYDFPFVFHMMQISISIDLIPSFMFAHTHTHNKNSNINNRKHMPKLTNKTYSDNVDNAHTGSRNSANDFWCSAKFDRAKKFFRNAAAAADAVVVVFWFILFRCALWIEYANIQQNKCEAEASNIWKWFDGPWCVTHPRLHFYHIYSSSSSFSWNESNHSLVFIGDFVFIYVCANAWVYVLSAIFSMIFFPLCYIIAAFLNNKKKNVGIFVFLSWALLLLHYLLCFFSKYFRLKMLWRDRVRSRHLLHRKICYSYYCWWTNENGKKTWTFLCVCKVLGNHKSGVEKRRRKLKNK